jgi:hypothetical protein
VLLITTLVAKKNWSGIGSGDTSLDLTDASGNKISV